MLAEAAKSAGTDVFYAVHRRLFEVFFSEGQNIGDEAVLTQLAHTAGMTDEQVAAAWNDEKYEERLKLYRGAAHELNVRATPTIFFGEEQRIDGALPLAVFKKLAAAGAAAQHSQ